MMARERTASALWGVVEILRAEETLSPDAITEIEAVLNILRREGWSGFIPADEALESLIEMKLTRGRHG